jgi:DnaJ homolog subfamily C member 28
VPNAEEQIRRAIEEGKFENLPGKGKPLHLDENPFEEPEWRLANHVLKTSGFSLPWIEKRNEIEALIHSTRASLLHAQETRRQALQDGLPALSADAAWNEALEKFRHQLAEINRLILSYNLQAPAAQLQLPQLSIERELELTSSTPSDTLPD